MLNILKLIDHCFRKRKSRLGSDRNGIISLSACAKADKCGTVRGSRLSAAGNSSQRKVRARIIRPECDIVSHFSSACTVTDCGV